MVDTDEFRQAWGLFATGVALVTTIEPDGQIHGMSANGIGSVSLDPLLVLVCVDHQRNSYPLIKGSGRFAINILREEQKPIAEYYARPLEQRTGEVEVPFVLTERGSAFVQDSLSSMDCHVVSEHVSGDHTIFIGEVDEIKSNPGEPLIFFRSKYGRLDRTGLGSGRS